MERIVNYNSLYIFVKNTSYIMEMIFSNNKNNTDMEDMKMANKDNNGVEIVEKKESKIKKFLKSDKLKAVVQIGTTILTLANTVFLVWTCASAAEAEVNADVMDEYNQMKEGVSIPAMETVDSAV